MSEWENYIWSAIFFLLICAIFYLWKYRSRSNSLDKRHKYLIGTLELAKRQFAEFNIKFPEAGGTKNGHSCMLEDIAKNNITLETNGFISEEFSGKPVNVYFRVQKDDGPIFYAFNSIVEAIKSDYQNSSITIAYPDILRIEKKRHFIRVKPDKNDIRVIGVWKIQPGKRLPKSTSEIGSPLTQYKPGMKQELVQVEDISGAGLALRFSGQKDEDLKKEFPKGSQLLCLVVFMLEGNDRPVAFWCTGEIMNARMTSGSSPQLVLGLEFTNWAVLESSTSEIHWAHSSPSRGAKPMLQWVEQIEKSKRLKSD